MKSILLTLINLVLSCCTAFSQANVTVDTSVKYQTIEGWGHGGCLFSALGGFYSLSDTTYSHDLSIDYLDYIIDELGLTGSRIWEVGPRIDGTGTDNGDCDSLDWSKFSKDDFFSWYHPYVKYFSDRIKAKGYQTSFYSSPTYPTLATAFKPWVLYHPGERAQQMWGNSLYWKNTFGVDMNYAVIYNEPSSPVTTNILVEDAKAAGPRFISHGLITKIQYAEAVTPQSDWNFITPEQNDADFWANIGRISYHNYGNYNSPDQYRPDMRDYAKSLGITTAQTEMGDPSFDNLYSDLILGGVSYWEVAFSSGNTLPLLSGQTQFGFGSKYFRLRQLLHYVRPGDVRISSISNDTNLHTLAFNNKGKITTILESITNPMTVTVSGLPPGTYGVSQSAGSPYQELGIKTVGSDGTITINTMGNFGATTIYPYSGPNHPPIIVSYSSDKGYIFAPTSSINLSVYAVDEELDILTYQWSVFMQPAGTNASITSPSNSTTSVNGLTNAGLYIFKINVSDGQNISSKKVYLYKYTENPPAQMGQSGFRFGQPYGLVFSNPGDTTHANIELPTTSTILQVGIGDLAGSSFDGKGNWSLVSQPSGASATVGSTIYIYISIRANVTGMTVPGDYVFHCDIDNSPYPTLSTQIICTVHPTSPAPVISSITPASPSITLPITSTKLTALTSDPNGNLLRHWWAIKSIPDGASPVFDHQGLPVSNIGGLTKPGTYTFTLRVFNDLHETTRDVNIVVLPCQNKPSKPSSIMGNSTPCPGSLTTYQVDTVQNAENYTWTLPPGWIGSSTTNVINVIAGSSSGTISITANNSLCGSSPVQFTEIKGYTFPSMSITGNDKTCINNIENFSTNSFNGFSYKWNISGAKIIGSNNQSSIIAQCLSAGTATISLIVTNDTTGCHDTLSRTIAILPLPDIPVISGAATVCQGQIEKYSVITGNGISYKWFVNGVNIIGSDNKDNIQVKWLSESTVTLTLQKTVDSSGCTSTGIKIIDISIPEIPSISGVATSCTGKIENYYTSLIQGYSNKWIVNGGNIIGSDNTTNVQIKWLTEPTGTLTLINTIDSTGCNSSKFIIINISPLPTPKISGKTTALKNTTEKYSVQNNNGSVYKWLPSGGTINGADSLSDVEILWGNIDTGALKVTETTSDKCSNTDSLIVSLVVSSVNDQITDNMTFKFYPNPANDFIEITNYKLGITNFRIYNCLSELIMNLSPTISEGEKVTIDISNLEPGLYFLRIGGNVLKFVKI